jgi:glycosyltransferase involved in cell wall biosynthesis
MYSAATELQKNGPKLPKPIESRAKRRTRPHGAVAWIASNRSRMDLAAIEALRLVWLTGSRANVSCRNQLGTGAYNLDFSVLTSPDFEPAFWTPELLDRHSAWWGHVPFALWLVANTKPLLLVELGTHHGVSYAAFCEAVLRRRLATRCYAVDAWTGDAHSGAYEEDVYADLKDFHDKRYGSFSQLLRTSFDNACGAFADGTIDLLHIDGYHTYDSVRHDFDAWRPRLSDRAVVLFHDTNERREDFGVWRLLAELKQEVPVFEFLHAHGLGVAAVGAYAPEAAKWLCGLPSEAEIVTVRERFSLLGARWEAVQEKSEIDAHAGRLQTHAHALEDTLRQKEAQVQAFAQAGAQCEALLRERKTVETELKATVAQLKAQFEPLTAQLEPLKAQVEASQSERQRLVTELEEVHQAFNRKLSDFERVDGLKQELERQLADVRAKPSKASIDLLRYRLLSFLSRWSPPFSRKMTARFARSAQKRDPRRSLGKTALPPGSQELLPSGPDTSAQAKSAVIIDEKKPTILVVSHDVTRSGAPVLALNLIAAFSERYNVVCLALGGGELMENFRAAAVSLYQFDRRQLSDEELDSVVSTIVSQHKLSFAIANSVESRRALRALKAAAIPTVSLIHEFSSNTRPRSALRDVLVLSSKTVFSTKLTLQSAISDFWLYPGASIHIAPQGKCVIPPRVGDAQRSADEKEWLLANLRPLGSEGDFLVLGVGNIELRKGVDLFIQCAAVVANRGLRRRFRFIWIGDGFDPERELAYSVYLSDQIRRAELDTDVKILRSTSQLEAAYETADLLLLPSRLDPLPNVAIDALTRGLPVLCFAQTTGIADFLVEIGLGKYCVAEYLDTDGLADRVLALAAEPELRAEVAKRVQNRALAEFDMKSYVSKLEGIAEEAIACEARIKEDIDIIAASGCFRSDFYKHKAIESLSENQIIEVYVRGMASGLELRKPMPGFQPLVYLTMNNADPQAGRDPFAGFLQKGRPQGPWLQKVIQDGSARNSVSPDFRIALHLHAFYPSQLAGVVERLNLNQCAPDLFVSAVTEQGAAEAKAALSSYKGRVPEVRATPNRGRDIGPFLTEFGPALCSSYDIIGHLHTKKSTHVEDRPFAEAWNTFLFENLLGGSRGGRMLDIILSEMASNSAIGIVYPDDPHVVSWTKNRKIANELSEKMGLSDLPEEFNFPIGSMFWARSALVRRFVDLGLKWDDYPLEPVPIDGTLIHAIERMFGVAPAAIGLTSAVTNVRGLTR